MTKNRKIIIIPIIIILFCSLVGTVVAKYLYSNTTGNGVISLNKYYFTTSLTGDDKMIDQSAKGGVGYQYEASVDKTWNLYGGGTHNFSFEIMNYFDNERVTQASIKYTISVTISDPNVSVNSLITLKDENNNTITSGELLNNNGSEYLKDSDTVNVHIESSENIDYEDQTEVIITINSSSPYEKTLKMKFILNRIDSAFSYKIIDSVGSPVMELVLMVDDVNINELLGVSVVQPYFKWSDKIAIDNTNSLTYTYLDGVFHQQTILETGGVYTMQISRSLNQNASESIMFYKADTQQDYSVDRTEIEYIDDKYEIILP